MPVKIIEDDNDNTDNYAYDTLTDTDDIDDLQAITISPGGWSYHMPVALER